MAKAYNTVLIGSQCWLKQNLNYGTYVPVASGGQSGAGVQKCCQNLSGVNDASCPMGGLYEWDEMMNGSGSCNGTGAPPNDRCLTPVQGICPAGWHIPSHYEWTTLEKNVGSNPGAFPYDETTSNAWLGTNEGSNLKETGTSHWVSGTVATNSSNFTGLPAGYSSSGSFGDIRINGTWWASTENGPYAWFRYVYYQDGGIYRNPTYKTTGYSVRCIMD
jgi:uncharacterized protein (TIGR02145 family)